MLSEWTLEGQAKEESILHSLLKWHRDIIANNQNWCVSIRYSSSSGCYLGASTDMPDGFLAEDFSSLYQLIHLTGTVTESELLQPESYHRCVLKSFASPVLLFTTLHEESGTILIYGFRPELLDQSVFSAQFGPSYRYLSAHLVLPDGQYLYSSTDGEDDFSASDLHKLLKDERNVLRSGEKTIMKIDEPNGGFSLIYALIDIQNGPIHLELYHTLLISLSLFILVLIGLAVYVQRVLYRPILALAKTVSTSASSEKEKRAADPFGTLSTAFEDYRRQVYSKQLTIEQQSDMLYRSILLKMMLDSSYISSDNEAAYFQMYQKLNSFLLLCIAVSNAEWIPEKMNHTERVYHRNLALLDAEAEVETQYANNSPVCLRHEHKTFVLLRVREEEQVLLHNSMKDTLLRLNQRQKGVYTFQFSRIYTDPRQLHDAYREAVLHPDYVLSADQERSPREPLRIQDVLQLENRLISLIYVESYAKAYECLQEIIQLIYASESNEALIQRQVQSISFRTFRMLTASNPSNQSRCDAYFNTFDQMKEYTQAGLLDFWRQIFDELEGLKNVVGSGTFSADFSAVMQYVELHFRDPNLSLTNLSDIFHRPIASLSRDFQKYTGKGFLENLHSLRLTAAEEEIATTQNHMKDIAEHVGYANELTMNRAFKKYRGVSPSVYRAKKDKKA